MSFFSSPTSNRRIKSGRDKRAANLLEVTARPDRGNRLQVRRRFSTVVKVLLLLGLVGGVAFGGRGLVNRLVWENPDYALADIRVSTDGLLTRVQVLELLEVWEGKNIFTVDVARMKRDLDTLPQVEKADVRRFLPDRLEIRISERQPVAWVAASADVELGVGVASLLVDARGYVMRTRKVSPEHLALPRIIGVVMEDVAPGQKLPTAEALFALELIKLSTEDLRWQPRVVDVSKGYCLLVTDDRKARVTFGFDNIEGQLGRLRQLLDYVEPQNRDLQSVNLMLERNIPVVFAPVQQPPTLPVIDPKTGKPKPGAKGGSGAQTVAAQGGFSGGVVQTPAFAIPNPVTALPPVAKSKGLPSSSGTPSPMAMPASPDSLPALVAATPVKAGATRSLAPDGPQARRGSGVESAGSKKTQPDPDRVLKTAKLAEPSAPARQKEGHEKPSRRKTDREEDEEEEVRHPVKAVRVGEDKVRETSRSKTPAATAPESAPRRPPASTPSSMPPSDSLRKLFNPHG